jgi:DNA-directed RNA polymerase subunit RPC12/RpoP
MMEGAVYTCSQCGKKFRVLNPRHKKVCPFCGIVHERPDSNPDERENISIIEDIEILNNSSSGDSSDDYQGKGGDFGGGGSSGDFD